MKYAVEPFPFLEQLEDSCFLTHWDSPLWC